MKDSNSVIEISMEKFYEICRQVYEAGLSGSGELKEDAISEIMIHNNISIGDNWKIYTVEELANLNVSTVLVHSVWGRCWVSQRPGEGTKFMSFSNRGPVDFRSNSDPWNKPMKVIG